MLVISYASRELAHQCTKLEVAQQWLGATNAQALVDLIADAEALENAQALIDFYSSRLHGSDSLSIDFSPRYRAVLQAAGPAVPQDADGRVAWQKVRRLMLMTVMEQ